MRAKPFFYVCAGILTLAIAYGLGAQHVGAQSNPRIVDVAATPAVGGGIASLWVLDSLGRIYSKGETVDTHLIHRGTAPEEAVAIGGPIGDRLWVGMSNGNVYEFVGGAGTWTFLENVFGATVQVEGTSITDVKGKFPKEE